jgi:uncharacterized membrane protein YjdF
MDNKNLYAPPKASLVEVKGGNCTRDGKFVVVAAGSDLPPRCIICNAPVASPIKSKKLYWHSPWLYLLILINLFIYLIAGLIARKSFKVSAGLCEEHSAKRKRRILTLFGIGSGSLVVAAVLLSHEQAGAAIALFLAALVVFVCAAITGRKVYPRKITKEYARLAGCKEPFLASLE